MKKINEHDLTLLWHLGYYDGYLSAIALYHNFYVFVLCVQENPEAYLVDDPEEIIWFRKYLVYRLSDEQIKIELEKHSDFEHFVGTHTNYFNNKRVMGPLKPQSQWSLFYDKYKNKNQDYSKNEVVAYYLK